MRAHRFAMMVATLAPTLAVCVPATSTAQNPPPVPPAGGRAGGGGGGQGRRRPIEVLTLTTKAWEDGGRIPVKHAQPGHDVSPALSWSTVPEGTASFALIVHDVDGAIGNGTDDLLQW